MEKGRINQAGTRKEYTARGESSQKMMSFRLDAENAEYLSTKPNKGRFINVLLARAREEEQHTLGSQ